MTFSRLGNRFGGVRIEMGVFPFILWFLQNFITGFHFWWSVLTPLEENAISRHQEWWTVARAPQTLTAGAQEKFISDPSYHDKSRFQMCSGSVPQENSLEGGRVSRGKNWGASANGKHSVIPSLAVINGSPFLSFPPSNTRWVPLLTSSLIRPFYLPIGCALQRKDPVCGVL